MRYSLRTLLVILTLAAIVAAGFALNTIGGIFIYLGCLLLFMFTWRLKTACRVADANPGANLNPWTPHLIVLSCFGIAVAAAATFCCTCTVVQAPFTDFMYQPAHAPVAEAKFHRGLWISMPIGTAAAMLIFWLSWPQCPTNESTRTAI